MRRRNVLVAMLASAGAIAVTAMAVVGASAANDFYTEAAPSYLALVHGHLGRFLQLAPIYGGSLELRAPFAALPALWGGGIRGIYFASALPCMLVAALFCAWVAAQPRARGGSQLTAIVLAVLACIFNPIVLIVLYGGHPEEVLGAVMCVVAVLLASSGRAEAAGVVVGIAVANKPWALVAVPVVIAAMQANRRRALIVAAATAAVFLVPLAVVRDHGISAAANGADVGTALFNPPQLLWWLGPKSWIVHQARPGIVLASLVLTVLWYVQRRRTARRPESRAAEALLLLALVLLLRAAFDPLNNVWYHLPFLFALLAFEVRSGRPPLLMTACSIALVIVVPVRELPMSHDLRAALYAAIVLPIIGWLVARLYLPGSTSRRGLLGKAGADRRRGRRSAVLERRVPA